MSDRLSVQIEDQIATVTLSRADKHNALDMAMFSQIDGCIKRLKKDKSLRAVVVTGDGPDFCSGLDVKSAMSSSTNAFKLLFKWWPGTSNLAQRVSSGWREIPCPVIMVLHGRVWGGGLQIALGGDFRIASPDAELSIMEARWGLIPDMGGTLALREQLPTDVAKFLAMTGKTLSGQEALDCHLVTELHPEPLARAQALAKEIQALSPDSVAGVKKLYNQSSWRSQAYALAKESWYQIRILTGRNQRIKSHNQVNADKPAKAFQSRLNW